MPCPAENLPPPAANVPWPLPPPRHPGGPYRICCVCLGNTCRSPIAELILRGQLERAGLDAVVVVDSAGTGDWHVGARMNDRARTELARVGYLDGQVVVGVVGGHGVGGEGQLDLKVGALPRCRAH
jgi:hypothetical protein